MAQENGPSMKGAIKIFLSEEDQPSHPLISFSFHGGQ